jgi:hypothetical protein
MKMNMYVLTKYDLTNEQIDDARENLTVDGEIIQVPQEMLDTWRNMPPEWDSHYIKLRLMPIRRWLQGHVKKDSDILIVQGDLINVFYIVYWMTVNGIKCYTPVQQPNGKHVRFTRFNIS